jgi:hypothetical protein
MVLILSFTSGLILLWKPPVVAAAIFASLAIICTVKFVANHSEEADRKSFRWYEVCGNHRCVCLPALISVDPQLWLICAHVLPIFERISTGEIPPISQHFLLASSFPPHLLLLR